MAKCDEGYLCDVCGGEVTSIVDSGLYLLYIIGQLDAERLHLSPERHLRCNPILSQYIVDPRFPALTEGEAIDENNDFARRNLDPVFVDQQVSRITLGYRRLWEIIESETPVSLLDYPLSGDDECP